MIQIFLDNRPVIPTGNSSIKLTVENPYFTKSTSYTYDVELPLDIAENREVFGFINRIDVEKESVKYSARLVVDNVCVLAGTAHITSVSEKSVKVQLLGSAASYNYGNKMEETFIDELDMGEWFTTTWPDRSYWDARAQKWRYYGDDIVFDGVNTIVFERAKYDASGAYSNQNLFNAIYGGSLPWCAFPTVNSSADLLCNGVHFRPISWTSSIIEPFFRGYVGERPQHREIESTTVVSGAIQPYVWIMAQKVAEATGFELRREDNALYTNGFFRKIFIVNTNNYILCNKCLPHWSVNEWWTQIEQTFGVILSVDYASKRMTLMQRKDHYDKIASTVNLSDVVDEFTAEVDDDTNVDISANNVGFADFECEKYERLSEFILESAEINKEFNDIESLNTWATAQGADVMKDKKSIIFECKDGRHYIYSEAEGIVEVDMYRPRIVRDNNDIDVELRFVPARYTDIDVNIYPPAGRGTGGTPMPDRPLGSFRVSALSAPGVTEMAWYKEADNSFDIEAIINDEQTESAANDGKPDIVYLAIFNPKWSSHQVNLTLSNGGPTIDQEVTYPRALLRERLTAVLGGQTENPDAPLTDSLSLIPIAGQNNLASHTVVGTEAIDTTVRHCIRFIADRVPDPGAIFIIRNRRFVCEKIEADIAVSGLNKLMTGYFYEYN